MRTFSSAGARKLLHNKFVVILGDSIQRSVYKDLVLFLQGIQVLTDSQLREKGEMTFENDMLIEGGNLGNMHNGVNFREVRQYQSDHHLVRFYFLTQVYSNYLESVLSDFSRGPQPDILLMNSCIWDLTRYDDYKLDTYKRNLDTLFRRITEVLSPDCLVIWNTTMPVGYKRDEIPENIKHNLRLGVIEGNAYSSTLANFHKLDVMDMHYHFRFDLSSRCPDATHWNQLAHRKYTLILLIHIAQAWGVQCPGKPKADVPEESKSEFNGITVPALPLIPAMDFGTFNKHARIPPAGCKPPSVDRTGPKKRWHPYALPHYSHHGTNVWRKPACRYTKRRHSGTFK